MKRSLAARVPTKKKCLGISPSAEQNTYSKKLAEKEKVEMEEEDRELGQE